MLLVIHQFQMTHKENVSSYLWRAIGNFLTIKKYEPTWYLLYDNHLVNRELLFIEASIPTNEWRNKNKICLWLFLQTLMTYDYPTTETTKQDVPPHGRQQDLCSRFTHTTSNPESPENL